MLILCQVTNKENDVDFLSNQVTTTCEMEDLPKIFPKSARA